MQRGPKAVRVATVGVQYALLSAAPLGTIGYTSYTRQAKGWDSPADRVHLRGSKEKDGKVRGGNEKVGATVPSKRATYNHGNYRLIQVKRRKQIPGQSPRRFFESDRASFSHVLYEPFRTPGLTGLFDVFLFLA